MLTEPIQCSTCKAVGVNGAGVLHCAACYSELESEVLRLGIDIQDALDEVYTLKELGNQMAKLPDDIIVYSFSVRSFWFYLLLISSTVNTALLIWSILK